MTDGLKDNHRNAIIDTLSANKRVERAVLFGSRAMETFTPASDIDIALYGDLLTLTDQANLATAIDELPMAQRVDLLLHATVNNEALCRHIEEHGIEWYRRGTAERLDLPRRYRDQIEALLREHVPGVEVWAYGSRVTGKSHKGSDLDLVLRGPDLKRIPGGQLMDLIEALEESNVPIIVQAHDWARLPERFHREIEREYVVLVEGEEEGVGNEWKFAKLGDVCKEIYRYPSFYGMEKFTYGVPVVRGEHLLDNGVISTDWNNYWFVSEDYAERFPKTRLQLHDVVMSVRGSIGTFSQVDSEHVGAQISPNVIRISPDPNHIVPSYLYHALKGSSAPDFIKSTSSSSAVPAVRATDIKMAEIPLPPLLEQRAIAHILGTLDDKIELNRRMNETLEEMVRALFKSWFVDFDPVRTKMEGRDTGLPPDVAALFPDRLVKSELGQIPEGWEVKALDSFGEIVTGKTPSTKVPAYFGDDVPFLRIPDMHGKIYALQTQMMLSSHGAASQPQKTLPPGSVSVSCIATPGLVVLNHRPTQTNQQINSIIPRDQSLSEYIYWSCRQLSSDIKTGGFGGSVFVNMNKSTFSSLPTLDAELAIIHEFDQLVSPIHTSILENEKQSQILAQVRDTLLPKLISGQLRVHDAEHSLLIGD